MNQAQHNAFVVQRFYEQVLSQRQVNVVDALFAPLHVAHAGQARLTTRDQVKQLVHANPPDRRYDIVDLIADEERVAARVRSVFTLPPDPRENRHAARAVYCNVMGFFRLAGGVIEESLHLEDNMSLRFQAMAQSPIAPAIWNDQSASPPSLGAAGYGPNIALFRRFTDELNRKNLAVFDALCAPGYACHGALDGKIRGKDALRQGLEKTFVAFPDFLQQVEDIVAAGSKVAARITSTGTQTGPFDDLAPTGRRVQIRQMCIVDIRDGKIVVEWDLADMQELFRQLKG